MTKIKLVCLMPTYNKQETLAKAIESVMMQKADFDYKLIILDDCSQDNSYQIAQDYQKKYPQKIDIVRNATNLKLLRSIMHGYTLLKGADYFCVLDADDWYTDDQKFAEAVSFLDKHKNYSMYMTNIIVKKEDNEDLWCNVQRQSYDFSFKDRMKGKAFFVQTSGIVYRNLYFKSGENKQYAEILNYSFPESYRADGFRFEWYLQGGKAHFENKVTAVYNYDTNGIWSSQSLFEQYMTNTKLMFSCAQFFPKESAYYMKKAKQLFCMMMENTKDIDSEKFAQNKDVISDLFLVLYKKRKSKFLKLLINFIPIKKIRKRIKNNWEL